MTILNREALVAASVALPKQEVQVPELGGSLIVRGMLAKEQQAFYESIKHTDPDLNFKLIVRSLVDENGERLLKDEEFTIVAGWPGPVYQRVLRAVHRVNGIGDQEGNG